MSLKTEQLISQITSAFKDTIYPGDHKIVNHPGRDAEYDETEAFFKGKTWQDLAKPNVSLPTGYATLTFLSSAAWKYFLPAHLIQAITDPDSDVQQLVVFHLTPPTCNPYNATPDRQAIDDFTKKISQLSKEQCKSISTFFQYLQSEFSADYADDIYPLKSIIDFWHDKAK